MTEEPATAPLNLPAFLRATVQQIQAEPQRYRLFGVYWWVIKALLKRHGYGPADLYMLGSYIDPETAAMVPRASIEDTIAAACEEYAFNAAHPHPLPGQVENPNGEIVIIRDADVGI
jgi:hypothetical protein